jgi:hypothetical protein
MKVRISPEVIVRVEYDLGDTDGAHADLETRRRENPRPDPVRRHRPARIEAEIDVSGDFTDSARARLDAVDEVPGRAVPDPGAVEAMRVAGRSVEHAWRWEDFLAALREQGWDVVVRRP